MSHNEETGFHQKKGEVNKENFLVFKTSGIKFFTVIIECYDEDDQSTSFPEGSVYSIFACHDCWSEIPKDESSYEEVINSKREWIWLYDINCGTNDRIANTFDHQNTGFSAASPMAFKFIKLSTQAMEGIKTKIIVGTR